MCESGPEELVYELRSESANQGRAKTEKGLGILSLAGISLSPRTGQDCLEKKLDTRGVSSLHSFGFRASASLQPLAYFSKTPQMKCRLCPCSGQSFSTFAQVSQCLCSLHTASASELTMAATCCSGAQQGTRWCLPPLRNSASC